MNTRIHKIYLLTLLSLSLFSVTENLNSKAGLLGKITKAITAGESKSGIKNMLPLVGSNFYEVERDQLYRSKQLTPKKLSKYIKKHKFRTIINLRGKNSGKKWYEAEKKVAEKHKVRHFDIPMSATHLPSKERIRALIFLFEYAQKPIYIHCYGGADRTGLASTVWLLLKGIDKKKARKQLSPFYHHVNPQTYAMDYFIDIWQGRDWALNQYDPKNYPKKYQ